MVSPIMLFPKDRYGGGTGMNHGDISGITIQQIRIFLAAAKHENFTKTAEELFMTQASVSRNIQSLEMALGLVLFVRHKRRVTLTNAGKSLARDLRQIMKKIDVAVDNAYSQQRNQFQRLIIGDHNCSDEEFYLLPIVREFERRYPNVELVIDRIFPNMVRENLISGEYDCAFSINFALQHLMPPNFATDLLFELPPCVVIANTHPLYKKQRITSQDLFDQPLVAMCDGPHYRYYWEFAAAVCQENHLHIGDVQFVSNESTMATELKRGRRMAIMDQCFAPVNRDDLRYIPLPQSKTKSGIVLAFSRDNTNPHLQSFRRICREMAPKLIR